MKKRPVGLTALLLTLLLLLLPAELWMKDPALPEEEDIPEYLTGEICRIDPGGGSVSLIHTNLSDTGIILVYFDAETDFSVGNTIRIEKNFTLREPESPTNPGQFDARLYYGTKETVLICYAENAALIDGRTRRIPAFFCRLRDQLADRLQKLFDEGDRGVIGAMLLGDKSELSEGTRELYQKSGISHLLAISGLHVSIFGTTLYRLLRRLGAGFAAAGIPAMLLVISYGILTGMSTSTARAVIMFLLSAAADLLGKSYDMLTALGLAALLLLLDQPLCARNASFLLSFGAVLGIGLVYPALRELYPVRRKLAQALLFSISVQLTTIPMVERFYCELPLYSVPLNLAVIPLMTVLMSAGILAVLVSFLSFGAARLPALVCSLILQFYEWLGGLSLRLPGAVLHCGQPDTWQLCLYYACLGGFLLWRYRVREQRRKRAAEGEEEDGEEREENKGEEPGSRRTRILCAAGCLLLQLMLFLRLPGGFQFTMLDVGQGDALFVRTEAGTTILVDGGSSSVSKAGTYRILPFLKAEGVGRLDYVIVTHLDEDHISGIRELLEQSARPGNLRAGTLLLSEQSLEAEKGQELAALARAAGTEVQTIAAGARIADSSAELRCLSPERGGAYADENGASVVLKLIYGEFSMLLTGDLEKEGELELLEQGIDLDCDVLKAGHHGSDTSSCAAWLAAASPSLTLISCGKDNSYGHPHAETLERLHAAGSEILLTQKLGALTIRSDGKGCRVEAFCPPGS